MVWYRTLVRGYGRDNLLSLHNFFKHVHTFLKHLKFHGVTTTNMNPYHPECENPRQRRNWFVDPVMNGRRFINLDVYIVTTSLKLWRVVGGGVLPVQLCVTQKDWRKMYNTEKGKREFWLKGVKIKSKVQLSPYINFKGT